MTRSDYIIAALAITAALTVSTFVTIDKQKAKEPTRAIMRCMVTNELTGETKLKYTLRSPTADCDK